MIHTVAKMNHQGCDLLLTLNALIEQWRKLDAEHGAHVGFDCVAAHNPHAASLIRALLSPLLLDLIEKATLHDQQAKATLEALCEGLGASLH